MDATAAQAEAGITPALAGSTVSLQPAPTWARDHPRVGGEHIEDCHINYGMAGSPPRWRGALYGAGSTTGSTRITPALAGSTTLSHGLPSWAGDHPRVGGEHSPCCPYQFPQ